jgi:hypothetical protein
MEWKGMCVKETIPGFACDESKVGTVLPIKLVSE